MASQNKHFAFSLSGSFCFFAAVAILVLPLDWLLSCMVAILVHECSHLIAIFLCTGTWEGVAFGFGGAEIYLPGLSRGKELACALAGPLGGLCLTLLAPWFPKLAVCALVQSLYNLLPVYPLDGGRAVKCLTDMLLPVSYSEFASAFLSALCLGGLLALGVYAWLVLEFGPVLFVASLVILLKSRKFPCKAAHLAVQ